MAFAVRMVKLKNYLNEQKHESNIADQVMRSGSCNWCKSSGGNVRREQFRLYT